MTTQTRILESLQEIELPPGDAPVILTIGTFDGLHLGHQALLREARRRAADAGGHVAVLTFQNHPRSVLEPGSPPPLLTPWHRKKALLLREAPDILVGLRFDRQLALVEAETFVRDVIAGLLNARVLISGPGFHFGHNRRGGPKLLARLGPRLGIEYFCHDYILHEGQPVSSTRTRRALAAGDVALAHALMTRPHAIGGTVVTGDRVGRTIGFPTANLDVEPGVMLPADGVYIVRVTRADGTRWGGMMNIGWRPTVAGREHRVEVHLLDFDGELTGENLRVDFLARLRDETRFNGIDDLRRQLERDRERAIRFLAES